MGSDDIYWFKKRYGGMEADTSLQSPILSLQESVSSPQSPIALKLNTSYILENIYYDFDRWEIRDDAKPSLDSLVRIMKLYPITVELGSHTDCRGTESYNLKLSQKRAESAVAYIISKGIEPERITAKGYGESELINHCDCRLGIICPEPEYQENRRTEFRIIDRSKNPPVLE